MVTIVDIPEEAVEDDIPMVIDPVEVLRKDLLRAASTMSQQEARFLVDYYYIGQENRKRSSNQRASMGEEPHGVLAWLFDQTRRMESSTKAALAAYSAGNPVGQWAESQVGIGPVISAGLLAHIEIAKAPTAGHIWNFAGLNPGVTWEKGQKRPWNADLKTLCWKIGESFVKVSNHKDSYYGPLYKERKEQEVAQNDAMAFADQAERKLATVKIGKDTEAYKWYAAGKLPPAHIHARAKRWVIKLFLSHWHAVAFEVEYGTKPPEPYAIAHLGHAHLLTPPGWPMG